MDILMKKKNELSREYDELGSRLDSLKATQANLSEELSELKRQKQSAHVRVDEAERNAEETRRRCTQADAEVRKEEDKLAQMQLKLAHLQKDLSTVSAFAFGRKKELKNQISDLSIDISSQTVLVSQAKHKSSSLDVSSAMAAEKREKSVLDTVVDKLHAAEMEFQSNSSQIAELSLRIAKIETEKSEIIRRIDALSREVKEAPKVEETPKPEKTPDVAHAQPNNNTYYMDDPIFSKLELLYPEHKVFALDSIDSYLRERISAEYRARGFNTVDEMLQDKGFTIISGEDVREIRNFVVYTPGNEPAIIRPKVESMLSRLEEYYPNRIIPQSLQKEHKKLSQAVSGLYQWLGYENAPDMLKAYGYKYISGEAGAGRPENNYDSLVELLVKKYENEPKPKTLGVLIFDNPEHKAQLKTLQNKSNELYGMSLKKYFEELGILETHAGMPKASAPAAGRGNMQDAAKATLEELYATLNEAEYGSFEQACARLEGFTVKKNKAGEIYVFSAEQCPDEVVIPYGIDFLSRSAFAELVGLKEVRLPTGLKKIGAYCFKNCKALQKVHFSDGLETIENGAFEGCSSLMEIILPESVSYLGNRAFAGCSLLENFVAPNPCMSVSDDTFDGCRYKIEEEEKHPDETAEADFTFVVDRKNQITITGYLGKSTKIRIPQRIEGKLVTTIGKNAFQGNAALIEVDMSDYITTMQKDAFRDCSKMEKIHLSEAIGNIISTTFNGCSALKEINIPDAISELKRGVFKDSPIRILHIGKSLRSIDSKLFYNGEYDMYSGTQISCREINSIDVHPENRWIKADRGCIYTANGDTLLAVLGSSGPLTVPEGVKTIAANACYGLISLTDALFPSSLKTICDSAFGSTNLRSVHFGPGMRTIEANAFSYCRKLSSIVFDEGIETIGEHAFAGTALVSVSLPASVRVLAKGCFPIFSPYPDQMHDLRISGENSVLNADGYALYQIVDGLKTLVSFYGQDYRRHMFSPFGVVPSSPEYVVAVDTKAIGEHAFAGCQNLGKVHLPDGLVSIADSAFADCANLVEVNIPASVITIGKCAFMGCRLKTIGLGSDVREIGEAAFAMGNDWNDGGNTLEEITISPDNTFFDVRDGFLIDRNTKSVLAVCNGFGTLAIPNDVTRIGDGAFSFNTFDEIFIPACVKCIGEKAFYRSLELKRLVIEHGEEPRRAVLYFPEVQESVFGFENSNARDQYMDCIRVNGSGAIFDFVKYDSLFDTIYDIDDKILVATDRLKSDVELIQHYRERYLAFLRNNAKESVRIVAAYDDLDGLNTLAQLGVFTGENIDEVIEFATSAGNTAVLGHLMNLKNSEIGSTGMDWEL